MKRAILYLLFALPCFGAQAREAGGEVVVSDRLVEKRGGKVFVSFLVEAERGSVRSGETLVLAPVLTDGTSKWSLPAVVVRGTRARIATARHDRASGTPAWDGGEIIVKPGETAPPAAETAPVPEPQPVPKPAPTTAERLAAERAYIAPFSEFKGFGAGLLDEDREESITVFYHFDRYDIDTELKDNARSLDDITASVREIQASSDSRVRTIVVAGFTSPEGDFARNDRLGFERSASIKRYIMERTGMADEAIQVYNGSEDWQGLRLLVERSEMPSKQRVLNIIQGMPVWDAAAQRGRETELMRLEGGRVWEWMRRNLFPELRNAAYIKVYYENR